MSRYCEQVVFMITITAEQLSTHHTNPDNGNKQIAEVNQNFDFLFAGDNAVETNQGISLLYMHAGTNPFEVINQAVK